MKKKILVTGGAGFIGSHLVDALISDGHAVRVLDNLEAQVHNRTGKQSAWPNYINPQAEYILGDVRDTQVLEAALSEIDIVYHFAAATGVGQSMYQIAKYNQVNILGTANLLEKLTQRPHHVEKIIVASSRAVYGEGLYLCKRCGQVSPNLRKPENLEQKQWEVLCPVCSGELQPIPTPEHKPLSPGSVYAITKRTQEELSLIVGEAYQIPVIVLRFFNVYGPRQSLSNPYTGIISTFIQRLRNHFPPEIYEDGQMTRDFVHVSDVVKACLIALAYPQSILVNIGSGEFTTILKIAQTLCKLIDPALEPVVVGKARVGDIRHCSADLNIARQAFGYQPEVSLEDGLQQVVTATSGDQTIDQSWLAENELRQAGLIK